MIARNVVLERDVHSSLWGFAGLLLLALLAALVVATATATVSLLLMTALGHHHHLLLLHHLHGGHLLHVGLAGVAAHLTHHGGVVHHGLLGCVGVGFLGSLSGLAGLRGVGVGDLQALVHERVAVEVLDGVHRAEGEAVLDEAIALGLAGFTVADDLHALDWAVHLKQLTHLHLIDGSWDVVHHEVPQSLRFGNGSRSGHVVRTGEVLGGNSCEKLKL